jgi:hypothetical protein
VGLSAVLLLVASIASRRLAWSIVATLGLLATLYAGLNGIAFMDVGRHDESSLEMTVGLVVAIVAYVVGLALPARSQRPALPVRRMAERGIESSAPV